jgi:hypothetical protein
MVGEHQSEILIRDGMVLRIRPGAELQGNSLHLRLPKLRTSMYSDLLLKDMNMMP